MILALDVFYAEAADAANAAGVIFERWTSEEVVRTLSHRAEGLAPYRAGQLYLRELPSLVPVVQAALEQHPIECVVVDGYVDLGARGPGLGRHLFDAFDGRLEVVGVAKNAFVESPGVAVLRGASSRPLWVTSTGDERQAAEHVRSMAGAHRIPTMLGLVDRLSRMAGRSG